MEVKFDHTKFQAVELEFSVATFHIHTQRLVGFRFFKMFSRKKIGAKLKHSYHIVVKTLFTV